MTRGLREKPHLQRVVTPAGVWLWACANVMHTGIPVIGGSVDRDDAYNRWKSLTHQHDTDYLAACDPEDMTRH